MSPFCFSNQLTSEAAMGSDVDEVYEKKLSKEEKKALAKKKREAKKAAKGKKGKKGGTEEAADVADVAAKMKALDAAADDDGAAAKRHGGHDDGMDHDAADALAAEGTILT